MTGDGEDAALILLPAASTTKAAGDRFTGEVWVDTIAECALPGSARLATVRFSPGARTAWHRHASGQTLHVTEGQGLLQAKAGQLILMRPGDTVYTAPGVWHWHGALPDYFMTHLALADSGRVSAVAVQPRSQLHRRRRPTRGRRLHGTLITRTRVTHQRTTLVGYGQTIDGGSVGGEDSVALNLIEVL
jgi:quercetin dioxygenase-like cupin family protein